MLILPLVVVLAVLICLALASLGGSREVVLKDYGFAFVNTGRLMGIMRVPGAQTDVAEMISVLNPDGKIVIEDGVPSFNDEKLSSEIPAFFNDNSYLYIPWDEAVFLSTDLKLRSIEGKTFLIKGMFFDEQYTRREEAKELLLLSCTKNLFVAIDSFSVISNGERFDVEPMDLVLFDGYNIRTATVTDNVAERSSHGIAKDSLVIIGDNTYLMEDFLGSLGLTVERDSTSGGLEKIEVPQEGENTDDPDAESTENVSTAKVPKPIQDSMVKIPEETFQYCLGYRYDYPKDFEIFSSGGVWHQKRDEFTSEMETAPLFAEERVYFPDDYIVVDMGAKRQQLLPAISKISRSLDDEKKTIVSSLSGDKEKKLPRSVIYNAENYFFTDEVTISWKDSSYTLAPFSYVSYDGQEILEFYDAAEDTFKTFILQVDSIKVLFDDGSGIDVVKRNIIFDEQTEMLMLKKVSSFGSIFDD
jgi:hypothetical protein